MAGRDAENVRVVGAGLAGAAAVQELRAKGFDGRVILIGAEPHPPYERPPLSKEYLRGEVTDPALVHPAEWYAENDIELRTRDASGGAGPGRAERGARGRGAGRRRRGAPRHRRRAAATPGQPSRPGVHWSSARSRTRTGSRTSSAASAWWWWGPGFIGAEIAASARKKGVEVTVLEMAPVPLSRALGEEVGAIYGEIHRSAGGGPPNR